MAMYPIQVIMIISLRPSSPGRGGTWVCKIILTQFLFWTLFIIIWTSQKRMLPAPEVVPFQYGGYQRWRPVRSDVDQQKRRYLSYFWPDFDETFTVLKGKTRR